jgi:hypothetical protein
MARGKKHTAEQIVNLLQQVEVGVANGKTLPQVCKEAEIVEQTYYRWRKEYGGLKVDQARRLRGRSRWELWPWARSPLASSACGKAELTSWRLGNLPWTD